MASGVAVMKTSTDLQPLCYEHHVQMSLVQILLRVLASDIYPAQTLSYDCPEPGCLIGFTRPIGYFVTQDGTEIERDSTLEVACPHHGLPMYLAEVKPQKRRLRICKRSPFTSNLRSTNEASLLAL